MVKRSVMGEGVSLSLLRNGFPVGHLLGVSVPFSRAQGLYGGVPINDASNAVSGGFSSDLQVFVLPISDPILSDDDVRPKTSVPDFPPTRSESGAVRSIFGLRSDGTRVVMLPGLGRESRVYAATADAITGAAGNTNFGVVVCVSNTTVGETILTEAANPDAVIPGDLNAVGRPKMGSFRAMKARIAVSRIADVGLSDRSLKILGTVPPSSKLDRFVSEDRQISSSMDSGGEDFPPIWSVYVSGI